MGRLRPTDHETDLNRTMALEYFDLHGILGLIYEIDVINENRYGDDDNTYKEPREVPIIFQQFPEIKTLRKLGWYNQDTSELPWIMYIPFFDESGVPIEIQENVILEFTAVTPSISNRKFKVEKVAGRGFSSMYWVVNVVPIADSWDPDNWSPKDVSNGSTSPTDTNSGSDSSTDSSTQIPSNDSTKDSTEVVSDNTPTNTEDDDFSYIKPKYWNR